MTDRKSKENALEASIENNTLLLKINLTPRLVEAANLFLKEIHEFSKTMEIKLTDAAPNGALESELESKCDKSAKQIHSNQDNQTPPETNALPQGYISSADYAKKRGVSATTMTVYLSYARKQDKDLAERINKAIRYEQKKMCLPEELWAEVCRHTNINSYKPSQKPKNNLTDNTLMDFAEYAQLKGISLLTIRQYFYNARTSDKKMKKLIEETQIKKGLKSYYPKYVFDQASQYTKQPK